MNVVEYALKYLFLSHKDDINMVTTVAVEDCGNYSEELKDYSICFDLQNRVSDLFEYFEFLGSKDEGQFRQVLRLDPTTTINYPAKQANTTFTEALLNHYGSAVEVAKVYGVELPVLEEDDLLVDMEEAIVEDSREESKEEGLLEEEEGSKSDEEDLYVSPKVDESDILSRSSVLTEEEKDFLTSSESEAASTYEITEENETKPEELVSEEELFKRAVSETFSPPQTTSESEDDSEKLDSKSEDVSEKLKDVSPNNKEYIKEEEKENEVKASSSEVTKPQNVREETHTEVTEVMPRAEADTMEKLLAGITSTRMNVDDLIFLLTGKRRSMNYEELSKKDFDECMEVISKHMPPEKVVHLFRVVMNRFWRFGEVELVSKVVGEMLAYLEEEGGFK